MIKIRFPRKPLSSQRKKAVELAKKLKYSEDEYDSIAESEKIEDFGDLFNSIGRWQGVFTFIDDTEIEFNHLCDIYDCINKKIPFTNLKWYNLSSRRWNDQDFRDFPKKINNLSEETSFFIESDLNDLTEMGLIEVIEYKKEYKVIKEKFKEKICFISDSVKKIVKKFDNSAVLEIIDNLPDTFKIIQRESIDEDYLEEEKKPEGEEGVDWYNSVKWHKEVLDLLKKIEENTRRGEIRKS